MRPLNGATLRNREVPGALDRIPSVPPSRSLAVGSSSSAIATVQLLLPTFPGCTTRRSPTVAPQSYRYLGMSKWGAGGGYETGDFRGLFWTADKISTELLVGRQQAYNSWVISTLWYTFGVLRQTQSELVAVDKRVCTTKSHASPEIFGRENVSPPYPWPKRNGEDRFYLAPLTGMEKELHGRFYKTLQAPHVDVKTSVQWLQFGDLFGETEGFICAIQDQVVKTNNYRKHILKDGTPDFYRTCRLRHLDMCFRGVQRLPALSTCTDITKPPRFFFKNLLQCTVFWNRGKDETEKKRKYLDRAYEIFDMWALESAEIIPIVISANDLIPVSLAQHL
ncbi:unnamed protein product [Euphydryas editha]|uniref:Uncharacterized protein n=1 Tax=Euphydryas editha TaxID=104508 RepID=A0AAU9UV66_EUPED|nr:unnamed protein product [Euphydryas editha]